MAIDTAEKRRSVAGITVGWGITPNASKDAEWRAQVAWNYSGIAFGEAAASAGGWIFGRKWYIYPDGRRLYQTEEEARYTLRQYLRSKKKPQKKQVERAIQEALAQEEDVAVFGDANFLNELTLPQIPGISFDFAPPPVDNSAMELAFVRTLDAQARLAQQQAQLQARQRDEEALLMLLLA